MLIRNSKVLCMLDPYLYLYQKRVKVHMLPMLKDGEGEPSSGEGSGAGVLVSPLTIYVRISETLGFVIEFYVPIWTDTTGQVCWAGTGWVNSVCRNPYYGTRKQKHDS
jgi:hypothetical protein